MKLTHHQTLDAPLEDVWAAFMDLDRIGRCFPGADVTEVRGDDFVGYIRARLGPFRMTFDGTGSMTDRDADAGRARLEATGRERHGLGNANIAITLHLSETTTSGTRPRSRTQRDEQWTGQRVAPDHAESGAHGDTQALAGAGAKAGAKAGVKAGAKAGARTEARLVTDLVFIGAPMNFGTGLVQRASDPLVARFLTRMASSESAAASDRDEPDLDIVASAADLFGSFASSLRGRRSRG